jgi:hypothetical protein
MGLTIRRATPDDWSQCLLMAQRFLEDSPYGVLLEQRDDEQLGAFVGNILEFGIVFVAESELRLVGMLAALPITVPMTGDILVDEVAWWVAPEQRAGSVGPRLLAALESEVRTNYKCVLKMIAPWGSRVGTYLERRGYRALETSFVRRLDDEGTHGAELLRRRQQRADAAPE